MGSGGIPNRPQIDPKWEEILQITQSGYQMAPKTPWINVPHSFLPIFGSPLGLPNRPKIHFWRKRVLQGTPFYRFLWQMLRFSIFWQIFVDFWWNLDAKIDVCFYICSCFFQTGDPHKTLYFTMWNLLFHFSYQSKMFEQILKIDCKTGPRKNIQKKTNWDPKWIPNCWKLRWGNIENH